MKRIVFVVLVAAELFVLLCACGGAQDAPLPPPAAESSSSSAEKQPSAAVCMGSISHPVHRLVQLGFFEKADELGYEGHILGLEEGGVQELLDCWLQSAREYDIAGAVCWVGDDSGYEFLKELHGMGVKTVVPYFPHEYKDARDIIDVNAACDSEAAAKNAAEFVGRTLQARGVQSGSIGVTMANLCAWSNEVTVFCDYMSQNFPQYTLIDAFAEGGDEEEAIERIAGYIRENPDMVAAFGSTGGSAVAWGGAKEQTGRADIIVVGYNYAPDNLLALESGQVDALVGNPLYKSGYVGMELIHELVNGAAYHISQELWYQPIQADLIRLDGEGPQGPAYYNAMYARSAARFGS